MFNIRFLKGNSHLVLEATGKVKEVMTHIQQLCEDQF